MSYEIRGGIMSHNSPSNVLKTNSFHSNHRAGKEFSENYFVFNFGLCGVE